MESLVLKMIRAIIKIAKHASLALHFPGVNNFNTMTTIL